MSEYSLGRGSIWFDGELLAHAESFTLSHDPVREWAEEKIRARTFEVARFRPWGRRLFSWPWRPWHNVEVSTLRAVVTGVQGWPGAPDRDPTVDVDLALMDRIRTRTERRPGWGKHVRIREDG